MQLTELAQLSDDPFPAVTRILFTENDMKARRWVLQFGPFDRLALAAALLLSA